MTDPGVDGVGIQEGDGVLGEQDLEHRACDDGAERVPSQGVSTVESKRAVSDGIAVPAILLVPQDYVTIAAAVAVAVHGTKILIQAGEHQWHDRIDVNKVPSPSLPLL